MERIGNGRKYTADEYLSMTDLEGSYELVSGEIYNMSPPPSIRHQAISFELSRQIGNYIVNNKGNCRAFTASTGVKLNESDFFEPDIFVICDPKGLDEHKYNGAPDWVIEILSPSNSHHDCVTKLEKYKEAGVREYWIVDPDSERVLVYPFAEQKVTGIYTFDDDVPAGIYKDNDPPLLININKYLRR